MNLTSREGDKSEVSGALDGSCEFPLVPRAKAGFPSGINFGLYAHKSAQKFGIFIVNYISVRGAKKALFLFNNCHKFVSGSEINFAAIIRTPPLLYCRFIVCNRDVYLESLLTFS